MRLLDKRILVAGGTGFVGKRAVSLFEQEGAHVFVLSRKERVSTDNITYFVADLNNYESLRGLAAEHFDACVYMAANIPEVGQPKESYRDAKKSTLDPLINFCEVFSQQVEKFIYISTIDVLGACDCIDYSEDAEIGVASPYGLAKYCGEFYVKDYCERAQIPYTILRFSQVYGPNEPIVRVIPIMKNALVNQNEFTIYSDGSELRRFLYVDDAVQAIMCALVSDKQGIYNIAGLETCTLLELVHKMEKVFSLKLPLKVLNKNRGMNNVPSIAKAERELFYIPKVSIEEGLRKILIEENSNEKVR